MSRSPRISSALTRCRKYPRLKPPAQAGQGSGIVNACTFLGGSAGVAGGATAFTLGGFVAVLAMIALAGIIGAALSHGIPEKAEQA